MKQLHKPKHLSFYSYDSLGNPWAGGGGAVRDFEILRLFAQHTKVTLTVGRFPGFKPGIREGVEIRGLGIGLINNWFCRVTFAIAANFKVLFDRADLIGNSVSIYAPIVAELFLRRKVYFVLHTYIGNRVFKRHGPFGIIPFIYEQLFYRFGKNYFVVNHFLRDQILKVNPKANIEVTCNGINSDLLSLENKTSPKPFILFLGRFDVYQKGLDILISAYSAIGPTKGIDLIIAGRGSEDDIRQITALIPINLKSQIRIETGLSPQRKLELFSSCLFFAYPSRFEGFPLAPLEANASGKAVLIMDIDGFKGCMVPGETSLAVPINKPEELKVAMLQLIEDESLREKLGRQGRERARSFSWQNIAQKEWGWIETLYKFD